MATRMPRNSDTLPTEMAVARSPLGKCCPATFVMAFSTSGWPAAMTTCPDSCTANESGAAKRMRAPAAVSRAPVVSARLKLPSSQRPVGRPSTM